MTEREALKLALEALELEDMACRYEKDPTPEHIAKAITAIKEALTESETRRKEFSETTKRNMEHVKWYLSTHAPEPVAWRYLTRYPTQNVWTYCGSEPETKPEREALYTTPPQRKPSQQELDASYATGYSIGFGEGYEAGKATPPQPEQEPVAITITGKLGNIYSFTGDYSLKKGDKVYTTPPSNSLNSIKSSNTLDAQRTWVGLTEEDVEEVERWVEFKEEGSGRIPTAKLVRYIETKLKEKTRTWVGLSTDEFKFIASKYLLSREAGLEYFQEEIEAKLKEKNT